MMRIGTESSKLEIIDTKKISQSNVLLKYWATMNFLDRKLAELQLTEGDGFVLCSAIQITLALELLIAIEKGNRQ
jgi:hypothetical protein